MEATRHRHGQRARYEYIKRPPLPFILYVIIYLD